MRDFMADCITDVALDEDAGGDRCTLTPADSAQSQGLPIVVVMGTARASFALVSDNPTSERRASATLSRTQARALIRTLTGKDRDPDRQDTLSFDSGPWEGVWVIENPSTLDIDDTVSADLLWDRPYAISGAGVRPQ